MPWTVDTPGLGSVPVTTGDNNLSSGLSNLQIAGTGNEPLEKRPHPVPRFPTYPMAHLLGVPVEIRFEMYRDILQCSGLGVVLVVDLPVYKPCEDVEDGDVLEPPQLTYQYIIPKGFHAILGTSSTIYREFALYAARRYPVDEKDLEKIGNVDKIVAHYIFHHDTEKHPILGPSVHGSGTKVLRRVMRKLKKPGPEQIVCLCEYVDENAVSYLNWWDVLHRTLDYGYYDYLDYDAQYHNQINTAWEYDTHCVMANATLKLVEKGKKQSAAAAARPEGKRRRDGNIVFEPKTDKTDFPGIKTFHVEGNLRLTHPRWNRKPGLDAYPTCVIMDWESVLCWGYMTHPNYRYISHKNESRITPF